MAGSGQFPALNATVTHAGDEAALRLEELALIDVKAYDRPFTLSLMRRSSLPAARRNVSRLATIEGPHDLRTRELW